MGSSINLPQKRLVTTQIHVISSDEGARNPQGAIHKSKTSGISPCGRNDIAEQLQRLKEWKIGRMVKNQPANLPRFYSR
jgi:hypothetical protein